MAPATIATALPATDVLLQTLLDASLTGVIVFQPVYAADNPAEIVDLAYVQLNAAAQRMLQLPERPAQTFRTLYPRTLETGIFPFYCTTFLSGQAGRYDVNYQHDGLDNYFHLAAQRSGDLLIVSFTDTADHDRTAAELALRQSQAREQAARADAEAQRQRLHAMFMQAPAMICIFEGPEHVFGFVNPPYQQLVGERPLLGRPIREAMPELAGQPIFELLDNVYRTGKPFFAHEMLVQLDQANTGDPELNQNYYNFIYQPTRNPAGEIDSILVFAYDVTAQVRARRQVEYSRQQVQQLNQELAAANEAREARVQERTQALQQAQAEAEHQRARLAHLFAQAPAYINTYRGPEHVFELVHPRTQQLLGRPLQGRTRRAALPEVSETTHAIFDRVYQTGEPFHGQELLGQHDRAQNGTLQPMYSDFTCQPLYDEAGRIEGLMTFSVDVTDRVLARRRADALQAELLATAQRQVQERETFYQVFEQTPAAICMHRGPEHRYEYVNAAYQALFPDRELLGRTVAEALPEAVTSGFVHRHDRVYETGETFFGRELPLQLRQPDGQPASERYFTFTYQAYRENGEIVGISTFAFDVTDQVLARQQRETQQRQLRNVFEQAPVAICVFRGPDYVLDVVNPPMSQMLGRQPAQLVGRPFFEALPELTSQGLPELLEEVRRSGVPFVAQEREIRLEHHGAGPTGFYNFVYEPLRDEQGQVLAITCVALDVTEQVRARQLVQLANQELMATNEQLTRTNTDLDNFIYTASHDLRAPITNIEGLLLGLRAELPPARQPGDVPQILTLMQGAVERFKTTIEHLSDVTKLQKEHGQPTTPVALADILDAVRLDLQPLIAHTGARLEVDVAACPSIAFSAKNLRSVVYNLLSNALKYHHPDRTPHVRVGCRQEASYTVLWVQDNGLGLTAAQQQELFTMFRRLHSHTEGTGLGLYMVKRSVENAGGRVEVSSVAGVGSTFSVYFRR